MIDFDKPTNPPTGALRLGKMNSAENAGRLEIFVDGTWGAVCNKGFGPNEALIAC